MGTSRSFFLPRISATSMSFWTEENYGSHALIVFSYSQPYLFIFYYHCHVFFTKLNTN